jgi:VanZ family protein
MGTILSALTWRALARGRRWRPGPTLASLLSLTFALAMTVTPYGDSPPRSLRECIPNSPSELVFHIVNANLDPIGDLLNLFLLFPLTVALVLATRSVGLALATALLLPVAVELTQTELPGRYCSLTDVITNSLGALAGLVIGWTVEKLLAGKS